RDVRPKDTWKKEAQDFYLGHRKQGARMFSRWSVSFSATSTNVAPPSSPSRTANTIATAIKTDPIRPSLNRPSEVTAGASTNASRNIRRRMMQVLRVPRLRGIGLGGRRRGEWRMLLGKVQKRI